MNEYRIRTTGAVVTDREFRENLYPNLMLPAVLTASMLDDLDADPVLASPPPEATTSQTVTRDGAVQDELGNWVYGWQVVDLEQEQIDSALTVAKNAKNQYINEARLAANRTSFTHNGKVIACDELSRGDLDAIAGIVALTGSFPEGFPNAWKATDNSYIPLPTVDAFKTMYASMGKQGSTNFAHSQQLKAALAAATTLDEVRAITW